MLRQAPTDPASCPLCGSADAHAIGERDRHGRPLRTLLCEGCGLVRIDPLPRAETVDRYYAEDYRAEYKGAVEPRLRHCHRETLRALVRLQAVRALCAPGCRMLDVGSGAGFFPFVARRAGIACDGVDPNLGYARFGRERLGLDGLRVGTLADVAADPSLRPYDLVTIHHVLEHLLDPVAAMLQLVRLVRPGGLVLVEVPDIEADWHAPGRLFHAAHLFWFNEGTLSALARRAGLAPLEVTREPPCGHLRMLLRRPVEDAPGSGDWRAGLVGNSARIEAALRSRSLSGYALSAAPYRRAATRLARRFGEWRATHGAKDARAVVEAACREVLGSGEPARWGRA